MREKHEVLFEHMQSAVVLAACGTLMWTHSFEITGGVFAGLQVCTFAAKGWHRWHAARVRRRSLPPGAPA
jgi:hypothetical protein